MSEKNNFNVKTTKNEMDAKLMDEARSDRGKCL